ncbi:MAG TPA: hypothetical protein H9890_03210 [Candidatus Faecalibacterium intestinigallinarum]|uniref:Uncharacterized protein n=1 Tax=Candidatus Faecalibacterium intestinigallinarum TaxID=2838581 RepID=A0A9D1QAD6_9FIRM|nr:hypothetical protein [Candidatus Faecalibacterium intestinigallinarum]
MNTRQEALARQQELVNLARSEGRGLTADEQAEFDRCQAVIDGDGTRGEDGAAPSQDAAAEAQRAVENERRRMSDIINLCRQTGMDPAGYIQDGSSVEDVRRAAVDFLIQHHGPVGARMSESGSDEDNFRAAASDAMLLRSGIRTASPAAGAEQMRGLSLRDLAIECMAREGLGTTASLMRMSKDDLWGMAQRQFFNPTAAFPAILDNTIRKAIVQRYQAVPTTFQLWTTKGSVTDFKPTKDHEYLAGGAGEFLPVGEGGELKHDTPKTDLLPQRKISTYGRQFSMTREAFINDDIGFITQVPGMYAASAKRTINKQVYSILYSNPTIFDDKALFHADHGNLVTSGAAPSIENIQGMILKMMSQTDPFGDSITVQPRFIVVPVGYGFTLAQILQTAQIEVDGIGSHTANALYQYRNQLQVIEDGTLNTLAGTGAVPWFIIADPSYARCIQVDYLNGQETPTIRRMETPGQLGYVWDIWLDWGVTVVDYRGAVKNPGAKITL